MWDHKNKRILFIRKFHTETAAPMSLSLIFHRLGSLDRHPFISGLIGLVYGSLVSDNVIWCHDFSCCIFDKVMETVCAKMNYFTFCMLVSHVKNILSTYFCPCMSGILGILVHAGSDQQIFSLIKCFFETPHSSLAGAHASRGKCVHLREINTHTKIIS